MAIGSTLAVGAATAAGLGAGRLVTLRPVELWGVLTEKAKQVGGCQRGTEFAMHGRDGDVMHQLWVMVHAVQVDPVAGRTGVMGQVDVKAHIARHAHGCFHAEIREIACDHQPADTGAAQVDLKRGADKPGVDVLFNDDVVGRDL